MDTLWQDLRYAVRTLAKRPGFAAVVVLMLALGIGANSAIFSLISAVVLEPLPFENPDRLVVVWGTDRQTSDLQERLSYPDYRDWKEQNRTLEHFAAFRPISLTFNRPDGAEQIAGARVSAEFFPALGIKPALGRSFLPADDLADAERVVILSHSFWQQRLGKDPGIVGSTLILNEQPATVVGVLPAGFRFHFSLADAQVWTPLAGDAQFFPQRGLRAIIGLARLGPGVTLAQAGAEAATITASLAELYPRPNRDRSARLLPLHEQVVGDSRQALLVLWGIVGFVLLIACANVANLLLARGEARQKEFALRAALGAGPSRLLRQLLTESLLLALAGGALGLLLTSWGIELVRFVPLQVARLSEVRVDPGVLAFSLGISLLTGVLLGLAPASRTTRIDLISSLKEGQRTLSVTGRSWLRALLVVGEVALALVVVVGAALLVRSFLRLLNVPPGFRTEKVLTFQVQAPRRLYSDADRLADFHQEISSNIASLPGVVATGASTTIPLTGHHWQTEFWILGRMNPESDPGVLFTYNTITPDYFRAMGIPLLRGRAFTEQDRRGTPGAAIINEAMARRYWPSGDPLGERLRLGISFGVAGEPETFEIVGVVNDVHHTGLDSAIPPQIYIPYRQQTPDTLSYAVRTTEDPLALSDAIRDRVAEIDRDASFYEVSTLAQHRQESMADRRVAMVLLSSFGGLALLLAAVGLYGVISYGVNQRTQEMGIRIALGAQRRDILRLVLGQAMGLTLAGLVVGLGGALLLSRLLSSLLFGVTNTDPLTYAGVSLLLVTVALLACYLPARRATRVDPMTALRYE